jgi:hypothetical protein
MAFPEGYKKLLGSDIKLGDIRYHLREGVAAYSELIFTNRNRAIGINPIRDPKFSLLQLATMNPKGMDYQTAEAVQNFFHELAELTGLKLNTSLEV